MRMFRNNSKLKDQDNSPEGGNNESDLCSPADTAFRKETMKMQRDLRVGMNRYADYFRKVLENIRWSQEKLKKIHLQNCKLS